VYIPDYGHDPTELDQYDTAGPQVSVFSVYTTKVFEEHHCLDCHSFPMTDNQSLHFQKCFNTLRRPYSEYISNLRKMEVIQLRANREMCVVRHEAIQHNPVVH